MATATCPATRPRPLVATICAAWFFLPQAATAQTLDVTDGRVTNQRPKAVGHWGEDAVGFRWVEEDSRDARWNEMDTGPMMTSALDVPTADGESEVVSKAVSIRIGDNRRAAVCFDLQHMTPRCGWTGTFLNYSPTRFGLIQRPSIGGQPLFTSPGTPGWGDGAIEFRGLHLHGQRVVISYQVNDVNILESYWTPPGEELAAVVRLLEIAPSKKQLTVNVADHNVAVAVAGDVQYARLSRVASRPTVMRILPSEKTVRIQIWLGNDQSTIARLANESAPAPSLLAWTKPGPKRWGNTLVTEGEIGDDDGPLAVDSVRLPMDNPFNALMFTSGHDFFSTPGAMAVCTVHGDVWLLQGLDEDLQRIEWQRFATGLFQPLGLRIVDDQVYVLGRDQITRLWDLDNDGEADFYESFNNDAKTSPEGHDYSTCLQTDEAGNFYYASEQGVHRISSDGRSFETVATGLRNPNGLAVGDDGTITAAPQEGEWTPASALVEVVPGGYYGFGGPRISDARPLGYDPPLCWIPRLVDNSTGGQVWVPRRQWGPLQGHLLNLSFGQARILLTLLEPRRWRAPSHWPVLGVEAEARYPATAAPTSAHYIQGGSFTLPLAFRSGIMRGRFCKHDGHLYVSGMRGWLTTGTQDGCLERVRFTGKPVEFPTSFRVLANGVAISFGASLDRSPAEDPSNYQIQRWNYKYSSNYGSSQFKVSNPTLEGVDDVEIRSATLLDDRTVFLETAEQEPVMQLSVRYVLRTADGEPVRDVYYHTINAVPEVRLDPARLTRPPPEPPGGEELKQHLEPGLVWRFSQPDQSGGAADVRTWRGTSLAVPVGESVTPFLRPGPFRGVAEGYLQASLPGSCTFSATGRGSVRLRINHAEVLAYEGEDFSEAWRRTVSLKGGLNDIEIEYETPNDGGAALRILWANEEFAPEPIQPRALKHDARDAALLAHQRLRVGRQLFAELRCIRCHQQPSIAKNRLSAMPELTLDAPDLTNVGDRLQEAWMRSWLLDPGSCRVDHAMPRMFSRTDVGRQEVADVAAYLASLARSAPGSAPAAHTPALPSIPGDMVEAGAIKFEVLGCLSCHPMSGADETDEFGRLSLSAVGEKYAPGSLAEFLRAPHRFYASSRMPDFQLTADESAALSAYLTNEHSVETSKSHEAVQGDAVHGRELYKHKGCAACHRVAGQQSGGLRAPEIFPYPMRRGCMGDEATHRGPIYDLSEGQRHALHAFLNSGADSLLRRSSGEAAERLVARYRCLACHTRDGRASPRPILIAEEGRGAAAEPIPDLTWTGEKLHAQWTSQYLAGQRDRPLRPWLAARMPKFPPFADVIACGLAEQHGVWPEDVDVVEFDEALGEIGRDLTLSTALDCRQCHGVGDIQPRGDDRTKLAPGINFAEIRDRLRYDSYRRFVLDPPRYDLSVKMPRLTADGKTTTIARYFNGDARLQFDAIWHYLLHYEQVRPRQTSE